MANNSNNLPLGELSSGKIDKPFVLNWAVKAPAVPAQATDVASDTAMSSTPVAPDTAILSTPVASDTAITSTPVASDTAISSTPIADDTAILSTPVASDTAITSTPVAADTAMSSTPVSEDTAALLVQALGNLFPQGETIQSTLNSSGSTELADTTWS
jgi:hypothetical protein